MRATLAKMLDPRSIDAAASVIRRGGVVGFPTDTVYGLGCDPWSDAAVSKLFVAKGREAKPVPVLCSSLQDALAVVEMSDTARRLADEHWPGALTIVAPLKRSVPTLLDQGSKLLGVRVPDHPVAIALSSECGGFVTGTSANLSGEPSCATAKEVDRSLGDRIDAIIDGGPTRGTQSTVVKVVGGSIEVLRRGEISIDLGTTRRRSMA